MFQRLSSLFIFIVTLALCGSAGATLRPHQIYAPGDTVRFSIMRDGKVIGTQQAICAGTQWIAATEESLYVFNMETHAVFQRQGKTLDTELKSKACYYDTGLPRHYEYDLSIMNANVSHYGTFARDGYSGVTTRFGVRQPFNLPLESWPALFDNNFALEWELAMNMMDLAPGDSLVARVVIPQISQMVPVQVVARENQVVKFEGENVAVRVLELIELSQVLYIAHDGKLIRAVDPKQNTIVQRLASGVQAKVERPSFFATVSSRAGGYSLLLLFAAAWAVLFGWRRQLRADSLLVFVGGALLYWLAIVILEPLQQLYFSFALNPSSPSSNTYMTLLGSALVFAIIEQLAILLPVAGVHFAPYRKNPAIYIAIGAACGAGFGFMQSVNLTAFAADGSILSGDLMLQKFGLIGISAASGALFGLFISVRASFWFYLIPVGIKTLQNWTAAFLQKGALDQKGYVIITLAVAVATVLLFYWLRVRLSTADKKRR